MPGTASGGVGARNTHKKPWQWMIEAWACAAARGPPSGHRAPPCILSSTLSLFVSMFRFKNDVQLYGVTWNREAERTRCLALPSVSARPLISG